MGTQEAAHAGGEGKARAISSTDCREAQLREVGVCVQRSEADRSVRGVSETQRLV